MQSGTSPRRYCVGANREQLKEHAALCERMAATLRIMSNEEFVASRDVYEAWEKRNKLADEAFDVIKTELKQREVLK